MLRKGKYIKVPHYCEFGCCGAGLTDRQERRLARRREKQEWRREVAAIRAS